MDNVKELIRMATHFNVTAEYDGVLRYIYESEEQYLINLLNRSDVPDELQYLLEKRVAARFIQANKDRILSAEDLNPIKKLKEGDTEIEFSTDKAAALDSLIHLWLTLTGDITCYRQLKW